MPRRPQYHPHDQATLGDRPVSPPPPNPWDFFATRKPRLASDGLTKRELFAAMAMQGLLSDPNYNETPTRMAASCVRAADALIAELSKPTE